MGLDFEEFDPTSDGALTPEMNQAWARDGFLVLRDFVSAQERLRLTAQIDRLVAEFEPAETLSTFSADGQASGRDEAFKDSCSEISFFFETEAVVQGELRVPKARALNKIGHALHDLDPVFSRFSRAPRLATLAHSLGFNDPQLVQSMYIFKPPGIGGEVEWHQDETFIQTDPQSTVGLWFALEDATTKNGCLRALPGLHKGPIKSRFRRAPQGLEMETLDPSPWPEASAVDLEVEAGSLVVLHGSLPHASRANRSDRSRAAYALHIVDGAARYLSDNWLQRPDGFRGLSAPDEARP